MSATMVLRVLRAATTRRPAARSGTALATRRARSACAGRARRRAARRARAARRIRNAGLTLAELLVVLLILGMLAAVTTPALRRPGASAGSAARARAGALGAARAAAAARGDVVRVSVELAPGAFLVAADADGARSPEILRAGRIALPADARLAGGSEGTARAAFHPLGRARADTLVVERGDRVFVVVVDAWTGAVRVRER